MGFSVTRGPLRGLLAAVLPTPALQDVIAAVGADARQLQGPPAVRPLVAAALAADEAIGGAELPVLLVTATDREADELAGVLADLLTPESVAAWPSWETLPQEKLSPRADTVGRRLAVIHRLA
ncbi:MAG: transcription-repair coupling factor, partial [Sciscionella sp.]